jgi:hypothetical protein
MGTGAYGLRMGRCRLHTRASSGGDQLKLSSVGPSCPNPSPGLNKDQQDPLFAWGAALALAACFALLFLFLILIPCCDVVPAVLALDNLRRDSNISQGYALVTLVMIIRGRLGKKWCAQ